MYYIKQDNEDLVKYNVKLEKEKLEELKQEVIQNCAEIVHQSYDGLEIGISFDTDHIKNFSKKKVNTKEYPDGTVVDIYHFEYDEYKDSELVALIQDLLLGKADTIEKIKNPTLDRKKEKEELSKKIIEEMTSELEKAIEEVDPKKLKESIQKLEAQQRYLELNKDQKSDMEYYPIAMQYIDLAEVSRVKISTVEEINRFFKSLESKDTAVHEEGK